MPERSPATSRRAGAHGHLDPREQVTRPIQDLFAFTSFDRWPLDLHSDFRTSTAWFIPNPSLMHIELRSRAGIEMLGLANSAIIAAAFVTLVWRSGWPDLIVGFAIAAMNANAALEVFEAAKTEHSSANP